jgi:methylmalonyl-CoA/ethylmalonyl-CoA epimerase
MAPATAALAGASLGQIAIRAHDVSRAVGFYRDALGLRLLFQAPPGLAFFDCGGIRLMLSPPEPGFDHPGSVLYFRVADIRQTHAALVAAGVRFRDEPHLIAKMPDHDLWMAFFYDSEDNTLALMSEVRERRD